METRTGAFILPRALRNGCCLLLHSLTSGSGFCQKYSVVLGTDAVSLLYADHQTECPGMLWLAWI